MGMRFFERKYLAISNIPDDCVKEFNKSITEGDKPVGKITPLAGIRKISIQTHRKNNN